MKHKHSIEEAVDLWVEACRNESWVARERAAQGLAEHDLDALFSLFIDTVASTRDFAARNAALVWLERNTPDRLFQMYDALKDTENRLHLLNLYGRIRDPKAVPLVRRFLNDDDENVVNAAIETLGNIASPMALPILEKYLDPGDPWACLPAIEAIGKIGDKRSIRRFKPLLDDEFIRPIVLQAVASIGGDEAMDFLVDEWTNLVDLTTHETVLSGIGLVWSQEPGVQIKAIPKPPAILPEAASTLQEMIAQPEENPAKGALFLLQYIDPELAARLISNLRMNDLWHAVVLAVRPEVKEKVDLELVLRQRGTAAQLVAVELGQVRSDIHLVAPRVVNSGDESVRLLLARALSAQARTGTEKETCEIFLMELIWDSSAAVRSVSRQYFEDNGTALIERQLDQFFDFGRIEVVQEILRSLPRLAKPAVREQIRDVVDHWLEAGDMNRAISLMQVLGFDDWSSQLKALFETGSNDDDVKRSLIGAIPLPISQAMRKWLLEQYRCVELPLKLQIAQLILQNADQKDASFWLDVLSNEENPELISLGLQSIAVYRNPVHISLVRQKTRQWDRFLRRMAFVMVARADCLDELDVARAIQDESWMVRAAVLALVPAEMMAVNEIRHLVEDEDERVRAIAACRAVYEHGDSLVDVFGEEESASIELASTKALEHLPDHGPTWAETGRAIMEEQSLLVLEEWIRDRIGISYSGHRLGLLGMRVRPRMEALALDSVTAYLHYLMSHPNRAVELQELITRLTNNETYLFREKLQLEVLAEEVFPAMLKQRGELRIGSAGCSSGEEAVSLVCLWSQHASSQLERLRVFGLDIDFQILEKARSARYTENSFRGVDPFLKYRYFDNEGENYTPKDHIRRQTTFRWVNLFDAGTLGPGDSFDVILCRNVLIYFDDEGKRRVVRHLYNLLRPGGYLVVGLSESLAHVAFDFEPVRVRDVLMYEKKA